LIIINVSVNLLFRDCSSVIIINVYSHQLHNISRCGQLHLRKFNRRSKSHLLNPNKKFSIKLYWNLYWKIYIERFLLTNNLSTRIIHLRSKELRFLNLSGQAGLINLKEALMFLWVLTSTHLNVQDYKLDRERIKQLWEINIVRCNCVKIITNLILIW